MNQCNFLGRICNDLEIKTTTSGAKVCKATVAVKRDKEVSDFIHLTAFNKTAENLAVFCEKGNRINVSCSYRSDKYEKDGKTLYNNYFVIDKLEIVDYKSKDTPKPSTDTKTKADTYFDTPNVDISEDDLPF